VGGAGVLEPPCPRVAFGLSEMEQLEVEAIPLQVHDPDDGALHADHLLDEATKLHPAVGHELHPEDVMVERDRTVGVRAGDREEEETGDHALGRESRFSTSSTVRDFGWNAVVDEPSAPMESGQGLGDLRR
jgi:hypothetical protein